MTPQTILRLVYESYQSYVHQNAVSVLIQELNNEFKTGSNMLEYFGTDSSKLNSVKPGLMFLMRLAWESRTRLPLLIMSGFLALGLRVQMEININLTSRFIPRVRLEEEEFVMTDGEDIDIEEDFDSIWAPDSSEEVTDDDDEDDSYDEDFFNEIDVA